MFPPCGGGGKLFLALAGNPCGKLYSLAAYILVMGTAGYGRWRAPDGHMIFLVFNTME